MITQTNANGNHHQAQAPNRSDVDYARDYVAKLRAGVDPGEPDQTRLNSLYPFLRGARDVLQTRGKAALNEFLQSPAFLKEWAKLEKPARFKLLTFDDLCNRPTTSYLLDNKIVAGGFNVVYAPPDSFKSINVLGWSLEIAQKKPVIYVAAEGVTGLQNRIKAWSKHNKKGVGHIRFVEEPVDLLDPFAVEEFITQTKALGLALVVIDTLARSMLGGDENSARDMGRAIESCNKIQRETGAAVLVIHHSGKSGTSERGSSALRGAADMMIEMVRDDESVKVACSKSKDSAGFTPYYLKPVVVTVDTGDSVVLLPSDRVVTDNENLTENQRTIIEWLATNVFDEGARSSDLQRATGLSNGSFFNTLKSLSKRGLIEKDGRYDPWILTAAGKELAVKHGLH